LIAIDTSSLRRFLAGESGRDVELVTDAMNHKRGHKAKLADVLFAQSCLDHRLPLVTFDRDFRHYTRSGLVLL